MAMRTKDMSMLQLRERLGHLYDTDPLGYKKLVDCVLKELGEGRSELARQDDVLQSLTYDLIEAQKEALRLTNFVNEEVLRREVVRQDEPLSTVAPLQPYMDPSRPPPFDAYSFLNSLIDALPTPAVLYRRLSDIASPQQWAEIVSVFETQRPDASLGAIIVNACPAAKDLLRGRGVVL
eukprot:TRINITY_DN33812_c0_g1_i1.p1 TRINITY_DN33812_c0_g1~~TRINITY_DN33812_c0_g1_i1.p1  ORF type:complete len:179 (+),score=37.27 TRINITY_DN33812_c0_g1_i1:40-576(+)